mmetsp:Transcript_14076/g.34803  ORF Transcript_14076/g.34803 Transcript_14076/m.34803 type:complete len:224 (-) Transcript_14076:884-1555(-)
MYQRRIGWWLSHHLDRYDECHQTQTNREQHRHDGQHKSPTAKALQLQLRFDACLGVVVRAHRHSVVQRDDEHGCAFARRPLESDDNVARARVDGAERHVERAQAALLTRGHNAIERFTHAPARRRLPLSAIAALACEFELEASTHSVDERDDNVLQEQIMWPCAGAGAEIERFDLDAQLAHELFRQAKHDSKLGRPAARLNQQRSADGGLHGLVDVVHVDNNA